MLATLLEAFAIWKLSDYIVNGGFKGALLAIVIYTTIIGIVVGFFFIAGANVLAWFVIGLYVITAVSIFFRIPFWLLSLVSLFFVSMIYG